MDKEEKQWWKSVNDIMIQLTLVPWDCRFVFCLELLFFPRYLRNKIRSVIEDDIFREKKDNTLNEKEGEKK